MKKLFNRQHVTIACAKSVDLPVGVVQNTRKRIVPCQESRQQRKETACLLNWSVYSTCCSGVQVCNAKEQESHIEREEQGEERNGRTESGK